VLVNIVSNSIKYTSDGGKIEIVAKKGSDGVSICVADNGMGIPCICDVADSLRSHA